MAVPEIPSEKKALWVSGKQSQERTSLRLEGVDSLRAVAHIFNGLDLGFTLSVEVSPEVEQEGFGTVTITSSKPLLERFFSGAGPFWSFARMADNQFICAGSVDPEELQLIAAAEICGVNTEKGFDFSTQGWSRQIDSIRQQFVKAVRG